ncbi:MAG: class I SAM-dependent methyltransferase [Reichenbachiella sp.]
MKLLIKLLNFNSSRVRLYEANKRFASTVPESALVLDAGAGEQTYKHLFDHAQYEAADFEKVDKPYAKSTYVCDLSQMPVEDNRFDFIVFNQVMEHLPEPAKVLNELNRVLKPGGKMIYSGPLFYEEHEVPYDYYRYTQFGLKHLFSKTGFELEQLEWGEGYFGTVAYQLNRMGRYIPFKPKDLNGGVLGLILCPFMLAFKVCSLMSSILFHRLELSIKFTSKGYPKNYIGILGKAIK